MFYELGVAERATIQIGCNGSHAPAWEPVLWVLYIQSRERH